MIHIAHVCLSFPDRFFMDIEDPKAKKLQLFDELCNSDVTVRFLRSEEFFLFSISTVDEFPEDRSNAR